jgi:hypothetical protein
VLSVGSDIRTILTAAVSEVPEIGTILSTVVNLLWPAGSAPTLTWDQVRAEVEAVVGQAIEDALYQAISGDLAGMQDAATRFQAQLKTQDKQWIAENWVSVNNIFVSSASKFCVDSPNQACYLLPLFARFATLHLSILREAQLCCAEWGLSQSVAAAIKEEYLDTLSKYRLYVSNGAPLDGYAWAWLIRPEYPQAAKMWNHYNDAVFAWAYYWYFMNVVQFPNGVPKLLPPPLVYYLGPVGDGASEGYTGSVLASNQAGPWQYPLVKLSQIAVWTHSPTGIPPDYTSVLSGWQLTYGTESPGALQGPNLYGQGLPSPITSGDAKTVIKLSSDITGITMWYSDVVWGMQFTYADSSQSPVYGTTRSWSGVPPQTMVQAPFKDQILAHLILSNWVDSGTVSAGFGLTACGAMAGFRSAASYPMVAYTPANPMPVPTLWATSQEALDPGPDWTTFPTVAYGYCYVFSDYLTTEVVWTTVSTSSGGCPVLTLPEFLNQGEYAIRIVRSFQDASGNSNATPVVLADIPVGYSGTTWTDFVYADSTGATNLMPDSPVTMNNGWSQVGGDWGPNWVTGNSVTYTVQFEFADGSRYLAGELTFDITTYFFPTITLPKPSFDNIVNFLVTRQFVYPGGSVQPASTFTIPVAGCAMNEFNQYVWSDQIE